MMIVEPCNQERAEWPDATRAYVEGIEERNKILRRQYFEAKVMNNIKDCPWCDRSPEVLENMSGETTVLCINENCVATIRIKQQTKLKAIQAWNRRNRSLELTADYCDYYEQELIPELKAKITNNLRLAELIKDYFYVYEIGCECCTVRNCGECMVCLIMEYFVEEKNVKKQNK